MTDTITLKQAVGIILEGFTLPDAARKILETAYFAEAAIAQQAEQEPVAWLVTGPYEKRAFDFRSSAEAFCSGLNMAAGGDVYIISELVLKASDRCDKGTDERMCSACYSGQGTCDNAAPVVAPDVLKDAQRYRWLRTDGEAQYRTMRKNLTATPDELDAAIDAAMGGAND